MSGFLRNLCRNSLMCCNTIYKRGDDLSRLTLPWINILFHFQNHQPVACIHSSKVLFKIRQKERIEKQRIIDYVSPRKKKKVIEIWPDMTVADLAEATNKTVDEVFELMLYVDNIANYEQPTDVLTLNVIIDILEKANLRYKARQKRETETVPEERDVHPYPPSPEEKLVKRPAVVTIMGHVDHGKTTLLDYLRQSTIVDSEFGGITQHIGAFSVKFKSNSITFLDTPGHAAFKAMRSRGAHCTDIVILVVAADDGVMEQTKESIKMAREAQVPIIVAINKIDKPTADIELTKKMLSALQLVPEDMGGDTQVIPISALKGTNIESLIEAIITQAELSNLRADPNGFVEGVILESKLHPQRGKLSTALVRRGTLRKGCVLTAGLAWCKVRAMLDDHQRQILEAPPSTPVEVFGWKELPMPGDIIIEVESEKRAHEVLHFRRKKAALDKIEKELPDILSKREEHNREHKKILMEKRKLGIKKLRRIGPRPKEIIEMYTGPQFNIVLKCDVEGSLEAILDSLATYYSPLCKLEVVHSGVGNVTVSDVEKALMFRAVIYNFNIDVFPDAYKMAMEKNIEIRTQNIIYRFLEDVKKEINARLPEVEKEEVTGEAVVLQEFLITDGKKKNVPVAGCRCTKGDLKKSAIYKVVRDGVEIHRGPLSSMKNLKTEVTSIKKEQECGLRFEDTSVTFKPGDLIQSFRTYTVPQEINWNPY